MSNILVSYLRRHCDRHLNVTIFHTGPKTNQYQICQADDTRECIGFLDSFLGGWELDTLQEILLSTTDATDATLFTAQRLRSLMQNEKSCVPPHLWCIYGFCYI